VLHSVLVFCVQVTEKLPGQVSNDVSEFTCANFLQPGEKTPVAARLSTVTHEKGTSCFGHVVGSMVGFWRLNKSIQNKLNSMSNAYLLPELTPASAACHVQCARPGVV
jgi:hypothetical protein